MLLNTATVTNIILMHTKITVSSHSSRLRNLASQAEIRQSDPTNSH